MHQNIIFKRRHSSSIHHELVYNFKFPESHESTGKEISRMIPFDCHFLKWNEGNSISSSNFQQCFPVWIDLNLYVYTIYHLIIANIYIILYISAVPCVFERGNHYAIWFSSYDIMLTVSEHCCVLEAAE